MHTNYMLTLISLIFVLLGAINWFLIGAFDINFITGIFGAGSIGARTIYIIVGLMSLWVIYVILLRRDVLNYKNDFKFKEAHTKKNKSCKTVSPKKVKNSKLKKGSK